MERPWAFLAVLAVLAVLPGPACALRMLAMFPLPAHSHYIMFESLVEGLAERGHDVVLFGPFPRKAGRANWTHVDTLRGRPSMISTFTFDLLSPPPWWALPGMQLFSAMSLVESAAGTALCADVFAMPEFGALMQGGFGRFDVVLAEIFGSDCWAAVAHKLGVPLVGVSSAPDVAWMHERIGSVDNPSYIPNVFADLADDNGRMGLWQRLGNVVSTMYIKFLFKMKFQDGSDPLVREVFGPDTPPLSELVKNTSLVLLNRHVSIHAARPVVPNLVHVGGLHIKPPPGRLEPELVRWLDGAEHGVVFFSLGSLVRSSSMPAAMRATLLAAFARLPQRVLWKYEDDGLDLPANVRVTKWLSQPDVLAHPNTRLFITHGGLMGTLEALHCAVPMLGIPLFADQMSNIALYSSLGIADRLDHASMTADSVVAQITRMIAEPRHRQRAREVSALFRDRPRSAMDEAAWWIEYVVRHRGAPHLRTLGAQIPLHQYLLLDVAALAAGLALAALAAVLLAARALGGGRRRGKHQGVDAASGTNGLEKRKAA